MRLLYALVLSLVAAVATAQNSRKTNRPVPPWTKGMIVLSTNDTVKCDLRYQQLVYEGLLQVLDGDNILTLSVKDVKSFCFYDEKKKRIRRFFTMVLPVDNTSRSREFFAEYLYGNKKVSIVSHKTLGYANTYMEYSPIKSTVPVSRKYLLNLETGQLLPMSKSNALELLDRKPQIMAYVQSHGMKFKKVADYIDLFEYDRSL